MSFITAVGKIFLVPPFGHAAFAPSAGSCPAESLRLVAQRVSKTGACDPLPIDLCQLLNRDLHLNNQVLQTVVEIVRTLGYTNGDLKTPPN